MTTRHRSAFSRRNFLAASAAAVAAAGVFEAIAEERPPVTEPRATSGDDAVEPNWQEKLTITVGPKDADLVGDNDRVLQAAVDYVARLGGGTVQILPGRYLLRNAVYLQSKVRLLGSGDDTLLVKAPSAATKLAADSDWYDQEITLTDTSGFRVGDGVCLRTRNPHHGGTDVAKRTLVARDGNRFKLDRALRQNFWLLGDSTVATLFPILSGENISGIAIENLTLDGDKQHNDNLDGNYAGCIFLQDCSRIAVRGVTARNFNGDGISWQICHDVTVENCRSQANTGLGLHPGSGSQRPTIRGNRLEENDIGIFFCWGVKYGLAEKNTIRGNRKYGISIGHRDTNNLICDNDIMASGVSGVLFRPERGKDFAPHRNRLQRNRIVDSGAEQGIAVDVQGQTEAITIAENEIRETRQPMQRVGVRIGPETRDVKVEQNVIQGFAVAVEAVQG